jgi:hypothetical protein
MPNQRPVQDGVLLIYTGAQRSNAILGPVSGNGYPAIIGEPQPVEQKDVEALLATGQWKRPPRKRKLEKESE